MAFFDVLEDIGEEFIDSGKLGDSNSVRKIINKIRKIKLKPGKQHWIPNKKDAKNMALLDELKMAILGLVFGGGAGVEVVEAGAEGIEIVEVLGEGVGEILDVGGEVVEEGVEIGEELEADMERLLSEADEPLSEQLEAMEDVVRLLGDGVGEAVEEIVGDGVGEAVEEIGDIGADFGKNIKRLSNIGSLFEAVSNIFKNHKARKQRDKSDPDDPFNPPHPQRKPEIQSLAEDVYTTFILNKELQAINDNEEREADLYARMVTKLDPPITRSDFIKDLSSFSSLEAREEYLEENFDSLTKLPSDEIQRILAVMG